MMVVVAPRPITCCMLMFPWTLSGAILSAWGQCRPALAVRSSPNPRRCGRMLTSLGTARRSSVGWPPTVTQRADEP
jgi:hypothetical protein